MCAVDEQQRADLVGDRAERLEVDDARVGRRTGDDHLRLVLVCQPRHLVVVEQLGVVVEPVADEVEELGREVDGRAVREVAALVERHAHHGVARLEQRDVRGHVGVGAGVGLHVGVLAPNSSHARWRASSSASSTTKLPP